GFASGLLVYATIIVGVSLIGILKLSMSKSDVTALEDPAPLNDVTLLLPTVRSEKDQGKSGEGMLGGSLQQRQRAQGGGGGDDHTRANRGGPPAARKSPVPLPDAPVIEHSFLVIRPAVVADPKSLIQMKGPVGMMDSPPEAPPSSGPGNGDGRG